MQLLKTMAEPKSCDNALVKIFDSVRQNATTREGGCLLSGVPGGDTPPPTDTAAAGTHPTGMHSCFLSFQPEVGRPGQAK